MVYVLLVVKITLEVTIMKVTFQQIDSIVSRVSSDKTKIMRRL